MKRVFLAAILVGAASCARETPSSTPSSDSPGPAATSGSDAVEPVGFEMRNVRFHAAPDVILQVTHLRGRLISRRPGPPVFDDQKSFYIDVDGAELSLDAASVTALVNHVFAYEHSPLSDLEVKLQDGRLQQKGKLKKGVQIPFAVEADVNASGGEVRLHPIKVRAAGVPTAKLMDVFGIELDDLIRVRAGRGVAIRDNDLFLAPSQMLPAPQVRGRVSAARVAGDQLSLVLGSSSEAKEAPSSTSRNYIWFRGGRIRFGRLTMSDADLQLIDADPRDPFDFYAERYNDQLVAGYSRNTPSGALRTYMPDYDDLPRLKAGRLSPPVL
jgi:hypothetical protein